MGKNSKRPKSYYINNAKRRKPNNELTTNMAGFLCTCSKLEKNCVKEAYNILNEFANPLYGEEFDGKDAESNSNTEPAKGKECPAKEGDLSAEKADRSDSESEEDIESSLKTEIEALQNRGGGETGAKKRRFQQVSVAVNKCVFISTTVADPVELSLTIMDAILKDQRVRTRHLVRMVPVQKTCKAFAEDIEREAGELISERFPKGKTSFYVAFKARNNSSVQREALMKSLASMISEHNLEAFADYKTPDVVFNVDVVKNICCLGILPKYFTTYCKYNLLMLVQQDDKGEGGAEVEEKSAVKEIGDKKEGGSAAVGEDSGAKVAGNNGVNENSNTETSNTEMKENNDVVSEVSNKDESSEGVGNGNGDTNEGSDNVIADDSDKTKGENT